MDINYLLYRVKYHREIECLIITYSSGNGRILTNDGHQVSQQIFRPEKAETNVGRPRPFLQQS